MRITLVSAEMRETIFPMVLVRACEQDYGLVEGSTPLIPVSTTTIGCLKPWTLRQVGLNLTMCQYYQTQPSTPAGPVQRKDAPHEGSLRQLLLLSSKKLMRSFIASRYCYKGNHCLPVRSVSIQFFTGQFNLTLSVLAQGSWTLGQGDQRPYSCCQPLSLYNFLSGSTNYGFVAVKCGA